MQSGRVYLRCLGEEHGSELRDYSYSPVRAEPARPVRPQTLQSYCSDLNPPFLFCPRHAQVSLKGKAKGGWDWKEACSDPEGG